MANIVESTVMKLIQSEPFYGYFLTGMRRIYTKEIPTAGVSVTDKINLYVNLDFFGSLSEKERVAILKHELHHVLNVHAGRIKGRKHTGWNIACDIAINQFITDLPSAPDKKCLGIDFFPNPVNPRETAEYYYEQIQQQKEELLKKYGKGKGEGGQGTNADDVFDGMTTDDHSVWKDGEGTSQEEAENVVKNAAKDAKDKAAGSMPSHLESVLNDLFAPRVNWKSQLRQFFQASLRYHRESSRKKRNRRYGIVYAGKKKDERLRIYVGVDSSGSVSDNELKSFFSEIDCIVKTTNASVKVLIADAQIQTTFEYTPGMEIPLKGRGGTAYQPVFDYTNKAEEDVDGVIYFGDGDAFDTPTKPKYPVLWALTRQSQNPFTFGKFLKVETTG